MKVWHDWDSGPYETVTNKEPTYAKCVSSEMTEQEWQEWNRILAHYKSWQDWFHKKRIEAGGE
jgi:hypothetical protein